MVALLDDDDEWFDTKLERQLDAVQAQQGGHWIASSRMAVFCSGSRKKSWPRRLIAPDDSVAEYLFRFNGLRAGGLSCRVPRCASRPSSPERFTGTVAMAQ